MCKHCQETSSKPATNGGKNDDDKELKNETKSYNLGEDDHDEES